MVPSGSLLAVPFSVTVTPEVTVWFEPALAIGAVLVLPPLLLLLLLLPPPPPQAVSNTAEMLARVRPSVYLRIPSLYRRGQMEGSRKASQCSVSCHCFA